MTYIFEMIKGASEKVIKKIVKIDFSLTTTILHLFTLDGQNFTPALAPLFLLPRTLNNNLANSVAS